MGGGGDRVVTKIFVFMFSENPNLILLNFRDNATKMFKYWRYIFGENFVFFVKIFVVFNPSNGQNTAAKWKFSPISQTYGWNCEHCTHCHW